MANDGNDDNNNDPLRQYLISPRLNQAPSLFPLPEEHNDVTIPMPLTPSEFKNRLIFGPFSQNSSPSSSSSTSSSNSIDLLLPPPELNVPARKPESTHHLHRSNTAPAMAAINEISHSNDQAEVNGIFQPKDQRTEQSDSKSVVVRQAVALLVAYLSLGVLIYWLNRDNYNVNPPDRVIDALYFGAITMCGVLIMRFVEKTGWFDSFCFSVMLATTVGYGDRAFSTLLGRFLAGIWLLVSTLAVARAFFYLAEARVEKRKRERAKKVLGQSMSISDYLAADIDQNGCISKAEYVIYKLKQMEKITQEDMLLICNQFDKFDRTNKGRITLVDLLDTSV
ncbi:PREDICTED: two-pore potassium channel 2-like [Camelina sativa]|uniref:Two-pore potassium channel 2-like n=1 Tax=Camelina sativa TaxID=90675 RepID=A0ABM0UID4_CAMSA|nr:PREDICTED: two-pore potassium channel 2-like [Camelina sativa]